MSLSTKPLAPKTLAPKTLAPYTCVTCEIEITGQPTFHVGLPFCCSGCAADGPCTCSYDGPASAAPVRHRLDRPRLAEPSPADPWAELPGGYRD